MLGWCAVQHRRNLEECATEEGVPTTMEECATEEVRMGNRTYRECMQFITGVRKYPTHT